MRCRRIPIQGIGERGDIIRMEKEHTCECCKKKERSEKERKDMINRLSRTSVIDTITSFPSRTTVAVFGASRIRLFKASVVFPLAWDSSIFPTVMSVRIMAADSK